MSRQLGYRRGAMRATIGGERPNRWFKRRNRGGCPMYRMESLGWTGPATAGRKESGERPGADAPEKNLQLGRGPTQQGGIGRLHPRHE